MKQRHYRVTDEQFNYLQQLAVKLSVATGKRIEVSEVLRGMIDHYRIKGINEKTK